MADTSAILEYNTLRVQYRPDLILFNIPNDSFNKKRQIEVHDIQWSLIQNTPMMVGHNTKVNEISDNCWEILGLPNEDGVSCYANACIQSLLHCMSIRRILLHYNGNEKLKVIFNEYITKQKVNVTALREYVDLRYKFSVQQDASEFLIHLSESSTCLQSVLQHELSTVTRCSNCDERIGPIISTNFILILYLPEPTRAYTLQEVIDHNIATWHELDGQCKNGCRCKRMQKTDIIIKTTVLIVQLGLFSVNNEVTSKITNFRINGIPTAKIVINKKKYKVINGIFHHGNTLQCGHYTNMLRKNQQWFKVSDNDIKKAPWPKGAKDAFILFLEEI